MDDSAELLTCPCGHDWTEHAERGCAFPRCGCSRPMTTTAATWTREDLAWAAGLFDGEGCITLWSKRPDGIKDNAILQLVMVDEDLVRRIHRTIGLGTINGPYHPNGNAAWSPVWRWSVTNQFHILAILVALWPWLGKRRQAKAEQAIAAFYSRPRRYYRSRKAG